MTTVPHSAGSAASMRGLETVKLPDLMRLTTGSKAVAVALVDGPVRTEEASFAGVRFRFLGSRARYVSERAAACEHGTAIATILFASRASSPPGICPGCQAVVYPAFAAGPGHPIASPRDIGSAVVECANAGVRIINLSITLVHPSFKEERDIAQAIDHAVRRGSLIVAAAGNEGAVGGSLLTGHPGVIPVTACDTSGRVADYANLGRSIGRRGLRAPGRRVGGSGENRTSVSEGTSVSTALVTGAAALLWSLFPSASVESIRAAMVRPGGRTSIAPPILDAMRSYAELTRPSISKSQGRRICRARERTQAMQQLGW